MPYLIQCDGSDGQYGCISPAVLKFDDPDSAIVVAKRYTVRARSGYRYANHIRVIEVDELGYLIRVIETFEAGVNRP